MRGLSPRRRRRPDERPPAPWGSFPLIELVVLVALVLLVGGLFMSGDRGQTMIVAGLALGFIAGLELSIREHFAGYRSHTALLSGFVAVLTVTIEITLLPASWARGSGLSIVLGTGVVVFGACFYLLREAFKRRSGGLGFRA